MGADTVPLNTPFFCLFNIMGVMPAIYASLLLPSGRSANGVPAWPFVTGSFALGAFALLPYLALWTAPPSPPPPQSIAELEAAGAASLPMRALESRVSGGLIFAAALGLSAYAATADAAQWDTFGHLFQESRLVHVTSVDFLTLNLLAPFWVWNDAQASLALDHTQSFTLV